MCQSIAEGGQRCAAHTRPAYQRAQFGTPEWDEAAAAYASTPTGREEITVRQVEAEANRDIGEWAACEAALKAGDRMRVANRASREAVGEAERLRIAVDMDGVLYNLLPVLKEHLNSNHGHPLEKMSDNPNSYDLSKEWGLPSGLLVEALTSGTTQGVMFSRGAAYKAGLRGVAALRSQGHTIVIVTARDFPGVEDKARTATEEWLQRHGVEYDELHVTSDKNTVKFDVLIDDSEDNIRAAQADGRHTVLVDASWNKHITDMPLHQWEQIPEHITNLHHANRQQPAQ